MSTNQTAFFVFRPRRASELRELHPAEKERPYEVVAEVTLEPIDFENFSEDMLVDRVFLEDNAHLCATGHPMGCVLVREENRPGGILVVPKGAFVQWAAIR